MTDGAAMRFFRLSMLAYANTLAVCGGGGIFLHQIFHTDTDYVYLTLHVSQRVELPHKAAALLVQFDVRIAV